MMDPLLLASWLGWIAIAAGLIFFFSGTVGLLRFPDALTRLHALTKADNLGLGFVVLGVILQGPGLEVSIKLAAVWLLALLASATTSHLVAGVVHRSCDDERSPR